jgi:hypothetical protein
VKKLVVDASVKLLMLALISRGLVFVERGVVDSAPSNEMVSHGSIVHAPSIQRSEAIQKTRSATVSLSRSPQVKKKYLSLTSTYPPEPPTALPLAAPAPRRPHPASLPAGAAPSPQPRIILSPPPHPPAPNRDFVLTLATGLPAGVEDNGG